MRSNTLTRVSNNPGAVQKGPNKLRFYNLSSLSYFHTCFLDFQSWSRLGNKGGGNFVNFHAHK